MTLLEILNSVKPICKIDEDETDFDNLLKQFINDAVIDIFEDLKTPQKDILPIINNEVEIDAGLRIVKVVPALEIGDQVIGNKIFTTHEGVLEVYSVEEAPQLLNNTDDLDLPVNILSLIKYKVASLWFGFKKKSDLAQYWAGYYLMEKQNKISKMEIEETYCVGLPFVDFFN